MVRQIHSLLCLMNHHGRGGTSKNVRFLLVLVPPLLCRTSTDVLPLSLASHAHLRYRDEAGTPFYVSEYPDRSILSASPSDRALLACSPFLGPRLSDAAAFSLSSFSLTIFLSSSLPNPRPRRPVAVGPARL